MGILGLLISILAITLNGIAKFNLIQLVRQRCVAAAQAELDCIETTGNPVPDENFNRLWPKLNVEIEQSEGTGQWEGLELITIKASGMSYKTPVNVELSRYIKMKDLQQELQ